MKKDLISVEDLVAKLEDKHIWYGNVLQKLAEEIVRYGIPLEEVIKIDLSEKLLKELDREILNGEIISLQINAKPRMAKSTLGIMLAKYIDAKLKEFGKKPEEKEFGIINLARDQNEKIKKMRNPELMNDVILTDESNALEDTGENATVEKAQRDVFSDVQAGRYVHGIWVCPEGTMDKNCDVKLEIRNKQKGLIHTRVYYYSKSQYYYGWVLIGIADFDVSGLIKNWIKVEKRFFKFLKERKEEDRKFIEYWSKRDFYVKYMCKKYEKMELMNREGILHARDLDYADIRKNVISSIKPLAELSFISLQRIRSNIKSKIETEFRKKRMPMSMIGREMEYERILGFIEMYRSLAEIKENIQIIIKRHGKGKIKTDDYNKTMTTLKKAEEEIQSEIKIAEEQLDRLVMLNRKYNDHLQDEEK